MLLPGQPPVEVILRKSAQARRFTLRVSRLDGRVTLTMPKRAKEKEAAGFLQRQEAWLRETLANLDAQSQGVLGFGSQIPLEGRLYEIVQGQGRSIQIAGEQLLVPGDQPGPRLAGFLKVMARDRLQKASSHYAKAVGRDFTRLTLRDTRSRWGSCSHDGALMYSWRLIMAPPEVLDYVAAHEVAHLIEMNHSEDFWAVVARLRPDWPRQRAWLREEGNSLHRYRFD